MKHAVNTGCAVAFLLLCVALFLFLHAFTQAEDGVTYME